MEDQLGIQLPADLRSWLMLTGYGDIDDEISFRKEWIIRIERGQLVGGARFAQDILGNFYAYDVPFGHIYYLSRSEPVFALLSVSFCEFIETLVKKNYKLESWIDSVETQKYDLQ